MTSAGPPATVDGRAITEERVAHRLNAIRTGPYASRLPDAGPEDRRARRWVLRSLVAEEIINGQDGTSPDGVFADVTASITVGEDQVRVFYENNLDLYELPSRRKIRHHCATSIDDALLARSAMVSNAQEFPAFELRRGEFCGPFEEAVFSARLGDVVGPIESELGWHVAMLEEVSDARQIPFDEVRQEIEARLLSIAREEVFDRWLEQQRRLRATVLPAWGHPGDPTLPDFSHRH